MVCSRVSPFASVTVAVSGNRALKFVVPGRAHNSMSPFVSCWHEHRVTSSSSAPVTTNSKGGAIFRCLAEESISKMLRARSAASSYSSELIGSSARPGTQGLCAGRLFSFRSPVQCGKKLETAIVSRNFPNGRFVSGGAASLLFEEGDSHIIYLTNISASVIVDTIPSERDHANKFKNDPRMCCARTAQPELASGENLAAAGLFHSDKFSRRPFMARQHIKHGYICGTGRSRRRHTSMFQAPRA